jgi:hypothetical protein
MVRRFEDLKNKPLEVKEIREWVEEVVGFIFVRSQENLMTPVAWGDAEHMSIRKPTKISDTGFLAGSCAGPRWEGDNKIVLEYDCPYAAFVEYGTPPHFLSHKHLIGWTGRKLHLKGDKAVRASYAIAVKISKEGIPPHPFLRPAIDEAIIMYGLTAKPTMRG